MSKKYTKEEINQKLSHKKITLVGDYVGASRLSTFRCHLGHEWVTNATNVMYATNCPYCTRRAALTVEIINQRLSDRKITMICDNVSANKKSVFRCEECSNIWQSRLNSVLGGYGCIKCKKSGFSYEKEAHGYVLEFEDFIKYGISNTLTSRLNNHRIKTKNAKFTVRATKLFETGAEAFRWGKSIKEKFGGCYVSRDRFIDGWTETLSLSLLDEVVKTLDEGSIE